MEGSQDDRYREAAAAYGAALERLAGAYEADPDHRRDLLQEIHLARYIGPFVPGFIVFGMGAKPRHGTASPLNAVPFFTILGVVWWLNYRAAKKLGRQIAEIDKMESQS